MVTSFNPRTRIYYIPCGGKVGKPNKVLSCLNRGYRGCNIYSPHGEGFYTNCYETCLGCEHCKPIQCENCAAPRITQWCSYCGDGDKPILLSDIEKMIAKEKIEAAIEEKRNTPRNIFIAIVTIILAGVTLYCMSHSSWPLD